MSSPIVIGTPNVPAGMLYAGGATYGMSPSRTGAQNAIALNAALADAYALRLPIALPAGILPIATDTVKPTGVLSGGIYEGPQLIGPGSNSCILQAVGAGAVLTLGDGAKDIRHTTLRGFTIDGAGSAAFGIKGDGFGGARLNFEDLIVYGCDIGIQNTRYWWSSNYKNVEVSGCRIGMRLVRECQDSRLWGCRLFANTLVGLQYGNGVNQSGGPVYLQSCQVQQALGTTLAAARNIEIASAGYLAIDGYYSEIFDGADRSDILVDAWPNNTAYLSIHRARSLSNGSGGVFLRLPADDTSWVSVETGLLDIDAYPVNAIRNRERQRKRVWTGFSTQQARPGILQPPGWRNTWDAAVQTALAAGSVTPAWIDFIGDSLFQGFYADSEYTHGAIALLIAQLQALYGTEYAEYWPVADSVYLSPALTDTPPWVVNDTAHAANLTAAPGGTNGVRWAGLVGTAATFTTPIACTDIDLIYATRYAAAGQSWTYQVDALAPVVNVVGALSSDQRRIAVLTGGASAVHTVAITAQSADNVVLLAGAVVYPNGRAGGGIGYGRMAMQGVLANTQQSGGVPTAANFEWQGGIKDCIPSPFGFPSGAAGVAICLGANDAATAVAVATYRQALERIIDSARNGYNQASVCLVIPAVPEVATSDQSASNMAYAATWYDYAEAILQVAQAKGCAVLDLRTVWGQHPVAAGMLGIVHGLHWTTAGHADVANRLYELWTRPAP